MLLLTTLIGLSVLFFVILYNRDMYNLFTSFAPPLMTPTYALFSPMIV
jgi:hypothetical protein